MILFLTEGGPAIGLGHLSRCLSLAEAILEISKEEILFCVNKEAGEWVRGAGFDTRQYADILETSYIEELRPDWIVVDTYQGTAGLIRRLASVAQVALFDDTNDIYETIDADLLINGNIYAPGCRYRTGSADTGFLLGPRYLVMKPEYWEDDGTCRPGGEGILITTGGADARNLTREFISRLVLTGIPLSATIGPYFGREQALALQRMQQPGIKTILHPASLRQHILSARCVLTASGSSVYEVLRLGKVPIIYTAADNQRLIEKELSGLGVPSLGWWEDIDRGALPERISGIYESADSIRQSLQDVFYRFDGQGARRIARILTSMQ